MTRTDRMTAQVIPFPARPRPCDIMTAMLALVATMIATAIMLLMAFMP